jgi:ABC-type siderophore export system fused ATPase/permease subunit
MAVVTLLTPPALVRGVTLVTVTHDNRIFPFADRILHLEDGQLTQEWFAGASKPVLLSAK